MDALEVLLAAILRVDPMMTIIQGEGGLHGVASFDNIADAAEFASALEETFEVDDPSPYQCPEHDDENGWEVLYVIREE